MGISSNQINDQTRKLMGRFGIPIYGHSGRDMVLSIHTSPDVLGAIDCSLG